MILDEFRLTVLIEDLMIPKTEKVNSLEYVGRDQRSGYHRVLAHVPGKTAADVRLEYRNGKLKLYSDDYHGEIRLDRRFVEMKKRDAGNGLVEILLS